MKRLLLINLGMLCLLACNPLFTSKMKSQKVTMDGREMLYGKISCEQLYFDYPEWRQIEEEYMRDAAITAKLAEISTPFQVKIFLGTWCSDSKRETPHFIKIIQQAQLQKINSVEIWATDRKLNTPDGMSESYRIERVATFIFFRQGQEIGRIVETPEALLLEDDILNILSRGN